MTLHDGPGASVGDWIVTRHNNRRLSMFAGQDFVKNGDTWHVTAIETDGALQVRHRTHRGTAILPPDYVDAHVELAYAATVNRVQGMTSDHTAQLAHAVAMTITLTSGSSVCSRQVLSLRSIISFSSVVLRRLEGRKS